MEMEGGDRDGGVRVGGGRRRGGRQAREAKRWVGMQRRNVRGGGGGRR